MSEQEVAAKPLDPEMVAGWPTKLYDSPSVYWQGNDTQPLPRSMHKEHRSKVLELMRASGAVPGGIILVQGGVARERNDTDHEPIFRQESNFHYLFGVAEPDCYATIATDSGRATLFVPRLPAEYAVWMGAIASPQDFALRYEVDAVHYVDELPAKVAEMAPTAIYVYSGINTDSKAQGVPATFEGIGAYTLDDKILHPALFEARVTKTEWEKKALRFANKMSSAAHVHVMRKIRPGMMEYQMEADFMHYCYYNGGMRHQSYTSICGCGPNGSVLHYGHAGAPNNRKIRAGDMILTDQGMEYYCYASDITCSYPVDGQFTEVQRGIYEAVLDATVRVMKAIRPGVSWVSMHDVAHRTIAEHLLRLGYLQGDLDDICSAQIPDLFMPHGLGHLMGIDTHDVGGIPVGVEKYKTLRMNRPLLKDMCVTVEPGCYFIPALLDRAFEDEAKAKHLNEDRIRPMYRFGGVRIEDDIFVTEDGVRLITNVPRTVKEIEAVMSGMDFPIPDSDYPIPRQP